MITLRIGIKCSILFDFYATVTVKVFLCILFVAIFSAADGVKKFEVNPVFRGNWFKAYYYCHINGMKLARIASVEEKNLLLAQIQRSNILGDIWIAATNLGNNQVFYWMGHDQPMTFTDWERGEPSNLNGQEHCVEMRRAFGYKWNDGGCSDVKFFVCEKDE